MKNKLIVSFIAVIVACNVTMAQNNTNSPYSSRGYGEMEPFVNVFSRGMGGVINGVRTHRTISLSNPASLGALNQVTLDFAFRGDYSNNYSSNASKTGYSGNFNYFSLGFPVWRKQEVKSDTSAKAREQKKLYKEYRTIWSSAIGLTPFSNINVSYYKIQDTTYGTMGNYYLRSGGLNRVFFMNAFNIKRNLSIGLNTSFIFGQLRTNQAFYLQDTGVARAIFNERNNQLTGFRFDLGIQGERNRDTIIYRDSVTEGGKTIYKTFHYPVRWVYGATISNASTLHYTEYRTVLNKNNYYSSAPIDTVQFNNSKGKTYMPMSFSAGFSVTFNNKWMIAADYRSDLWASMKKSLLIQDSFNNSSEIKVGFAYRPDADIEQMNLRRKPGKLRLKPNLEYRMGFRLLNTGYLFRDNANVISPLKEYGISFGIGIPKLRDDWDGKKVLVKSMFNITGEYIHRGTTQNGMIAEDLYRLTIGFTLSDIWFKQKKFH